MYAYNIHKTLIPILSRIDAHDVTNVLKYKRARENVRLNKIPIMLI